MGAEAQAVVSQEGLMSYGNLLAIIGTIRPELWDVIITHGPLARSSRSYSPRVGVVSALDRVAWSLGDPVPWSPQETLLAGAAEMAHDVVRLAVASEAQGTSSAAFVSEVIDDWCGTPWPRKWPWPWPGPRPGTEGEGPQPDPWDVRTARVVGAVIFASVASRLSSGDLRTAFADGAERLAEAALAV
jgi:hypothetical protein